MVTELVAEAADGVQSPLEHRWLRDVVELDGREAHPGWGRFRDRTRDNALAERGELTLRYGWREVVTDPCGVAARWSASRSRIAMMEKTFVADNRKSLLHHALAGLG